MSSKWIVSTEWLAEHLDAPDVVVIDASWALPEESAGLGTPREDYLEERIPGAVFFDIDEIADTDSDLPHMLPSAAKFAAHMRRLGIGDGHRVIVYDTFAPMAAPRAWWMFRYFGHDDVAVLNGGLEKWTMEGRPTESGEPRPRQERHFTARPRASLLATIDDVRRALRTGRPLVADARAPGRFCGVEPEPWPGVPSGHMPGAMNFPFEQFIHHDGTYKSAEEIRATFAAAGIDPATPMIFTCGSGVTACVPALAAAVIGHENHAVYDGSWTEWATRPDAEIVTEDAMMCEGEA
ncbi:MAG TPA: 3-mercaptopyruvate sulfurtransferase [Thermopetrobacter sp.]|nr:3-mercaptopyruvate sulfurtransferase [Thermopetrobacter sp.]